MVSALNSWWPDGQIYRSTDSGETWSPLWDWLSYPTMNKYFTYDLSLAPWIGVSYPLTEAGGPEQIGWMMECEILLLPHSWIECSLWGVYSIEH